MSFSLKEETRVISKSAVERNHEVGPGTWDAFSRKQPTWVLGCLGWGLGARLPGLDSSASNSDTICGLWQVINRLPSSRCSHYETSTHPTQPMWGYTELEYAMH